MTSAAPWWTRPRAWRADGTSVLKLNIGNPAPFGFRTPDEVVYDMRQQLTDCEGYSPAKGLFSAPQGDHAVRPAQGAAECDDRRHLQPATASPN